MNRNKPQTANTTLADNRPCLTAWLQRNRPGVRQRLLHYSQSEEMKHIELEKPVLFIEFFIREVTYEGKDMAVSLPPHTLFYTGKSLSMKGAFAQQRARYQKAKFGTRNIFGFKDNKPCLVQDRDVLIYFDKRLHQKNHVLNIVSLETGEYFIKGNWERSNDQVKFSSHNLPYQFGIFDVDQAGCFETNFPRKELTYKLEVNQTYLFMCRRDEYQSAEWYEPNLSLMLYVKNHGLHQQITLLPQEEINALDSARLTEEEVKIRDHRKSKLKYELG